MRSVIGFSLAAGMLTSVAPASAFEFGTRGSEHPARSPQHFALELRFGPYRPQIDEEPGLTGRPFANAYGENPRVFLGLELDWQAFRIPHLGTLALGAGVGHFSISRPVNTVSGRPSGDENTLAIYPFWAGPVLRADVLWRELGIPVVPYAKAGMSLALWRASSSGTTSVSNNVSGKGHTWGTNVSIGLAFALDALDRGASRNMDNATGINNTYLFVDYYWMMLNGLGQTNALRVGDNTWAMGLAFEF